MKAITPKQYPFNIIEGFYLAQIAYHFQHNGLFGRLSANRSLKALAREFKYDHALLAALLEFLYQASDIVVRDSGQKYSLNPKYRDYYFFGFQLDKFIGAFGPTVLRLEESLRSVSLGRKFVNRQIQALAYLTVQSPPTPLVIQVVKDLNLKSMLDIGCGTATLLTELCGRDPAFQSWGVDESLAMCKIARKRVVQAKLQQRIHVLHGDARHLDRHLSPRVRKEIDAVQSKGLFNELFRHGDSEAVGYLKKLKKWFPGKLLFVVDYYGKLTRVRHIDRKYQHTLIHDLIQHLSAQGTPPADLKSWVKIYARAGCSVEHAFEGDSQGIEWFVHVVRL